MHVVSTLVPVALLAAVVAAAPGGPPAGDDGPIINAPWTVPVNGGPIDGAHGGPYMGNMGKGDKTARQAPIDTHVPFPPGSGGDYAKVNPWTARPCNITPDCGQPGSFCVSGQCTNPGSAGMGGPNFPPEADPRPECKTHLDCGVGSFCDDNLCTTARPECKTHSDCNAGSFCEEGLCTIGRNAPAKEHGTLPARQGPIETHVPFPPGSGGDYQDYVARIGKDAFKAECQLHEDCGAGNLCISGFCTVARKEEDGTLVLPARNLVGEDDNYLYYEARHAKDVLEGQVARNACPKKCDGWHGVKKCCPRHFCQPPRCLGPEEDFEDDKHQA